MPARLRLEAGLLMLVMLGACARVPIGRDHQDGATDGMVTGAGGATGLSASGGSNSGGSGGFSGTDARTVSNPADALPPALDAGGDGPIVTCGRDDECDVYVEYCAAPCGVCRPTRSGPSVARSVCLPPPNVSCINACAGKVAVCQQGQCTVR